MIDRTHLQTKLFFILTFVSSIALAFGQPCSVELARATPFAVMPPDATCENYDYLYGQMLKQVDAYRVRTACRTELVLYSRARKKTEQDYYNFENKLLSLGADQARESDSCRNGKK